MIPEYVNKRLAIALGWKKLETGNWLSPTGEIFALPPNFCGRKDVLAALVATLSPAEAEGIGDVETMSRAEMHKAAELILKMKGGA